MSMSSQTSWCPECQYYRETDTLRVSLVTAVPGLIDNTEDAVPGLLEDYTATNQIVGFDVRMASSRTRFHISATDVQAAATLSMQSQYSQEANTLIVSLVQDSQHCRPVCTDDNRITIWVDHAGKWESVVISHARKAIVE